MGQALDRLKEITAKLHFPIGVQQEHTYIHQVEVGEVASTCLYISTTESLGIHKWVCKAGTQIASHAHPSKEWVVLYDGLMEIIDEEGKYILKSGESRYFRPGMKHECKVLEDSKYITITVPTEPSFPKNFTPLGRI